MNLSRRFLCAAALGAVFALGLAGTALAADRTWIGGASGTWSDTTNWSDSTAPGAGEAAIFNKDVVIDGIGNADTTVGELKFTGDATLTLNKDADNKSLTVKKITVEAGKKATVNAEGDDDKFVVTDTNSIFNVGDDAVLTLKGNTVKGVGELQLLGKGTLVLKAPVTSATDLEITEGGTLDVDVANALPAVAAPVTITKGNLTLNRGLADTVNKITVTEGVLTLAQGVKIGKDAPLDGEVDLKAAGHLVLSGDLALKGLKTVEGSKITANGNVLTIIPTSPFVLDAKIDKGTLSLDVLPGQTATLSKDVANVVFNGKSGGAPTLKIEERVFVNHLDIRGSTTEPAKLQFGGENIIGTLKFVKTTTPLVVSYGTLFVTVEKLILADGAALEVSGGTALTIKDGTPGAKWNVKMGDENTDFRVGSAGLLSGNVEVTLGGGTLYLPHGAYPNLTLKAVSPPVQPTLEADAFEGDPVLTVGKVEISGSDMRMKATGVWKRGLEAGKTLTLLKVNSVNMNGKVIKGDPEQDKTPSAEYWKVARLEGTKTELVLTALKTISVPDLVAEASYSGNKCTVNVKVSGDVKVKEGEWKAEMILGDRPENYPAYENAKPGTNTREGAVFEVMLPSSFTSGTLRVKATNKEGGNFQGFVDVPLERTTPGGGGGGGGGGTPAPHFTIHVTTSGNGRVMHQGSTAPLSGDVAVPAGSSVTFVVSADAGYKIESLKVDGAPVPVLAGTERYEHPFPSVGANHRLEARFKAKSTPPVNPPAPPTDPDVPPGTPADPSIDPSSWERTTIGTPDAQGNLTVQLAATLKLEGTPKSLDVVASGMKEKPKAELPDVRAQVVVSPMPSVVKATKSYRLRLTCRTTKADIDSGKAAIEKVLVTMDDGKVHTIRVNKKLKDIAKPGGNPGGSKSSSGGGCDAGLSGLALAFVGAFLLRKKV